MTPSLFLTAPGPPCPRCGRALAEHPDRWSLDDYVRGITGQGPRIAAAKIGGVKCLSPLPQFDGDDPKSHADLAHRADWLNDRQRDAGL